MEVTPEGIAGRSRGCVMRAGAVCGGTWESVLEFPTNDSDQRYYQNFSEFKLARLRRQSSQSLVVHSQGASCFTPDVVTAHSCHKAWFLTSLRTLAPFSGPWFKKILNPVHYLTIFIEAIQYRRRGRTHVIAISNCIKRELQTFFGLPEQRITVIHSGVDCARYTPEKKSVFRDKIRKEYRLRDDHLALVFVANEFRFRFPIKPPGFAPEGDFQLSYLNYDATKAGSIYRQSLYLVLSLEQLDQENIRKVVSGLSQSTQTSQDAVLAPSGRNFSFLYQQARDWWDERRPLAAR